MPPILSSWGRGALPAQLLQTNKPQAYEHCLPCLQPSGVAPGAWSQLALWEKAKRWPWFLAPSNASAHLSPDWSSSRVGTPALSPLSP